MVFASSYGEVEDAPEAGYAANHVASDSKLRLVSTVRSTRLLLTELQLTAGNNRRLRRRSGAAFRGDAICAPIQPAVCMLDRQYSPHVSDLQASAKLMSHHHENGSIVAPGNAVQW